MYTKRDAIQDFIASYGGKALLMAMLEVNRASIVKKWEECVLQLHKDKLINEQQVNQWSCPFN